MKRLALVSLALALVLTACAAPPPPVPTQAPSGSSAAPAAAKPTAPPAAAAAKPAAPPAAAPSGEKILTIGFYANVNSIDPATGCSTEDAKIISQLYDRLVGHGTRKLPDGTEIVDNEKIAPRLAASWEASADGKTYTFKLTPGVKFPSGADVDADAVVYSFNRMLTMNQCGVYIFTDGIPDNYVSIRSLDKLTVQIQLKTVDPNFLNSMAEHGAGIVDKTVVDAHGGVEKDKKSEWMNTNSAGSGPFILEKFAPSDEVVMKANPTYRGGKPYYDKLVWKIIQEPANRVLLLEKGDIQFAYNIPFRDQLRLAQNQQIKTVRVPGLKVAFLGLNNKIEPFTNKAVREALAYAVPYDQIIKDVTYGLGMPMKSLVPPMMGNHNPSFFDKKTDPDKAKQLLAQAGFPNGFSFTVDIQSGSQEFDDAAVILQEAFKKVGVTMNIRKLDLAKYYEVLRAFQSQSYLIARTTGVNDPGYFLGYMLPCSSAVQYSAYCNKEVDDLLVKARQELDAQKRQALYDQIQKLHAADSPDLWLYVNPDAFLMRSNVTGFVYYPNLQEEFYRVQGTN